MTLHFSSSAQRLLRTLWLTLLLPLAASGASDSMVADDRPGKLRVDPALGIDPLFGRWERTIRFVYDPDNAPARFSDSARMAALLQQAWSEWERVSGVRFELAAISGSALDDRQLSNSRRDGLVRVFWGDLDGSKAAARAGPRSAGYDEDVGYFPYEDGDIELNQGSTNTSEDFMLAVLVHEIGHLIGLGHSDNPHSVMYANPYNYLRHPREDDIRAAQTMYGPAAAAFDVTRPLPEWLFAAPPEATAESLRYFFKPNQSLTWTGAYFAINGTQLTSIGPATPDSSLVQLRIAVGNFDNGVPIDLQSRLVVVDPFGYVQDFYDWKLTCSANTSCQGAYNFELVAILKTMPGTWKVYVLDMSEGLAKARTMLAMALPVTGTVSRNRPPEVTVKAEQGDAPDTVRFILAATDPENDRMAAVWYEPGPFLGENPVQELKNGVAQRTVDFGITGEHTLFVELYDNGPRYTGAAAGTSVAGDGFQTLVRLTVKLPLTNALDAFTAVASSNDGVEYSAAGAAPTAAVLAAVASTPDLASIITSNGSATTAKFRLGASQNGGTTTGAAFRSTDALVIAGSAAVQAADVGKAGDIFIVIRSITAAGDSWSYRDRSGNFMPWNGKLGGLLPAYRSASLPASSVVNAYNGSLPAGDHRIFIGYRVDGSEVLHYTAAALRLAVSD